MKKRVVALLLGMILTVTSLAGCGNKEVEESSTSATSEASEEIKSEEGNAESALPEGEIPLDYFAGTELEIAVYKNGSDTGKSFADKPVVKMAEEATGIHINWIEVEASVAEERTSVMLSSGELPDAMLGLVSTSTLSANGDLFYDFSEEGLLETYAPNVLRDYEAGGQGILEMITWADGTIRSLAAGQGASYRSDPSGIWYINKDWLDQLGMEVPTTAEEFYEVLCAFRDNDMNGNGDTTDEIPLSFRDADGNANFMQLANPFGIAGTTDKKSSYFMLKDGKIVPTVDAEEYKLFLEYYNKLAEEGLLDVEGFSQTTEQFNTKITENKVGVMPRWNAAEGSGFVGMKPFQGIEGVQIYKTGRNNAFYGNISGLVASADCSNVEALLHWWNYLSSTQEIKLLARLGEENVYWYQGDDGVYYMGAPEETFDPEMDYVEYQYTYGIGNNTCPYITPDDAKESDFGDIRESSVPLVYDMLQTEYVKDKIIPAEKIEERTFIEADLIGLIEGFMATSVVEGVTDVAWDQYLTDLEDYSYYEWLDWYQSYVDGEF